MSEVGALNATRAPEDDRPLLLMAQDEGRFGRISSCRHAWAPPVCGHRYPARSSVSTAMALVPWHRRLAQ